MPEGVVKKRKTVDNLSECQQDDTPNLGDNPNDVIDSGGESPDEPSSNESGSEAGDSDSSSTDVDEDLFLNQSEEVGSHQSSPIWKLCFSHWVVHRAFFFDH